MKFAHTTFTILCCLLPVAVMACANSNNRHVRSRTSAGPIAGGPTATSVPVATSSTTNTAKTGSLTLTTSLSNSHVLMPSKGTLHVAIDLRAEKATGSKRLPMNLALVIDRSGSMRGDKIQDARTASRHLIKQLSAKDRIAIISYADDVRVDLPSSLATAELKKMAMDVIGRIQPGGSTNLSGGLFRGQDEVERHLAAGQVNRVILMSDGLANRGVTDTKAISQHVQKASQRGVTSTTMGVGTDYNEDLMTAVADRAGGNYYFIQESKQIVSVFTEELRRMFSTVAQNTVMEIAIEDGVDLKQVFGYTFTRQNDKVTIPLAEIFGGQKRSILLEVVVPLAKEGKVTVGQVTLNYDDVSAGLKPKTAQLALGVTVTKNAKLVENNRNRTVEERLGEVQVAQAIEQAADHLKNGRFGEAKRVLRAQQAMTASQRDNLGGSARLDEQVQALKVLVSDFEAAEAAPAAAPSRATIKRAKAGAYKLKR